MITAIFFVIPYLPGRAAARTGAVAPARLAVQCSSCCPLRRHSRRSPGSVSRRLVEVPGNTRAVRAQHGSQDADPGADGMKVRLTAVTRQLEAGHLCGAQTRLPGPHRHLGLDFGAGGRQVEALEIATVKGAESVAQLGQLGVVDRVEDREQ